MRRVALIGTLLFVAACGSSPSNPSSTPAAPTFTATLLPANETTPVAAAEQAGTGSVTITFNLTRDANQTITAATATFQVAVTGFPSTPFVTAAHIHPGAAGVAGGALVSVGLSTTEIALTNGAAQFTRGNVNMTPADAQNILNNPGGFYFNVHSQASGQGFARGQLVRIQ